MIYKISDIINAPTAIFKVLSRYIVKTKPNSLVEDIVTLGFGVYNKTTNSTSYIFVFNNSCQSKRLQ
jgi:hypothetical protein